MSPDENVEAAVSAGADEADAAPTDTVATEASSAGASSASPTSSSGGGGPQEVLAPKERRRRARAGRLPGQRGPRTPEERQEERDAIRAAKARERRGTRVKAREKARSARAAAPAVVAEPVVAHEPGAQKVRQGIVVSDRAAKTITVRVDTSRRHRRYQKIVRSSKTLHAHDEHDEARLGDLVRVIETRPLSKTKRWRLADVLERAK
jgi:small subunit ribosomal protein S17